MCLSLLHMNAGINHPFQQVFLFTHLLCLLPVGLGSLDTEVGDFLLVHHPSVCRFTRICYQSFMCILMFSEDVLPHYDLTGAELMYTVV